MGANKINIHGVYKKQMINCKYQKTVVPCSVQLEVDFDKQIISLTDSGSIQKFKPASGIFKMDRRFCQLEGISFGNTYYLQLLEKNNKLVGFEFTNHEDTGYQYVSNSALGI